MAIKLYYVVLKEISKIFAFNDNNFTNRATYRFNAFYLGMLRIRAFIIIIIATRENK